MKITAIMGSHRNNGHTSKILNYFLEQIREDNELRLINVNKVHVEHCKGCDYCIPHQGECVIKDDDMTWIYDDFMDCDLLVIASPVYFTAFPSKLKTVIDRTQMIYNLEDHSHIPNKKIIFYRSGRAPRSRHRATSFKMAMELHGWNGI